MAYKFQSGDATLSGSVTLVSYQDLLFETDAASNIGTAAKAVGITYSDRLTASVAVSASAVYADNFHGNGSGITGITADGVDTTTSAASATRYVPFVDQATGADGESLLIHSALALNPSTGVVTIAGSAAGITIGSAVMVEADFEKLDDITNGTATASKAVVLDASKNITGLNEVSGASLALSGLTSGRVVVGGAAGLLEDSASLVYNGSRLMVTSKDGFGGAIYSQTGSIAVMNAAGSGYLAQLSNDGQVSASSNMHTAGILNVQGAANLNGNTTVEGNLSANNGLDVNGAQSNFSKSVSITGSSDVGLNVSSIYDGGASILSIGNILAGHTGGGTHTAHLNSNGEISGSSLKLADGMIIGESILPREDDRADLGSAAKKWKIIYGQRLTASVALSASAVYADNLYGNGSGLTGISSDSVDVSDSSANSEFRLVGVAASGDGVTLTTMDTAADRITMNAQSGKLTLAGALQVGGILSQSLGQAITGSQFLFKSAGGANKHFGMDGVGLFTTDASGNDSVEIGYSGTISGSGNADIGGTLSVAKNKFSVNAAGDASATDLILDASSGVLYLSGDGGNEKISCNSGNNVNINAGGDVIFNPGGLNLLPENDGTIDLGSSAKEWKDLYVDGIAYLDQVNTAVDRGPVYATLLSASTTLTVGGVSSLQGVTATSVSASSTLSAAGNVQLDGADDAVAFVVADSMYFRDAGTGLMRRDSWSDIMAATAGDGITNTGGVLSVEGNQNIDIDTVGNASRQLTAAGMNYATASITTDVTYTLPASPSTGDIVYIKLAAVTSGKHAVISGSGMQLIDGVSTLTASSPYAGISLCYVASDVWRVF